MFEKAQSEDLLYASNGDSTVSVYTYRMRQQVGMLAGIAQPMGMCSARDGTVFVTDAKSRQIAVYRHGESARLRTLHDEGYAPDGCAVDPASGNLAVTNSVGPDSGSPGTVAVYKRAEGKPKLYASAKNLSYTACTYDDAGNLFADGSNGSGPGFELVELRKGSRYLTQLTIGGKHSLAAPGGLQWDGKYVVVGNAKAALYQLSVGKGGATVVGSTKLAAGAAIALFWIPKFGDGKVDPRAHELVGAANYSGNNLPYYAYPAGGTPIHAIADSHEPYGVTVSLADRDK